MATLMATQAASTWDLVVVGGSFAGLVAARQAASRGLRTLVIEKKREPGAHVHTTGLLTDEAADVIRPPDHLIRAIPGVRLYAPSLKQIDLTSRGYAFLATDTPGVLRWLTEECQAAGATVRLNTPFETADAEADGSIIFDCGSGPERTHFLVGADGARSRVAECFGLSQNRRWLVGLEAEYEGVGGVDPGFLHTFLDSRIAPGYIGWIVPGVGVTQVGLACRRADKPNLERFTDVARGLFDFSKAQVVARRSGIIPSGGTLQRVSAPGVLLVGDSAGMVSPMTAGGIFTAFHHGIDVANAVADWLGGSGPDPAVAIPRTYPRFRFKSLMRRALDLGPPNWLYNLSIGWRPTRAFARLVYFHSQGLASGKAWREAGQEMTGRARKA